MGLLVGLLVEALGWRSKGVGFQVPLAMEISFSSGCTQPYPRILVEKFSVSIEGYTKPSVQGYLELSYLRLPI